MAESSILAGAALRATDTRMDAMWSLLCLPEVQKLGRVGNVDKPITAIAIK
jgi:hypothetical protein